jgi:hypothetical protein
MRLFVKYRLPVAAAPQGNFQLLYSAWRKFRYIVSFIPYHPAGFITNEKYLICKLNYIQQEKYLVTPVCVGLTKPAPEKRWGY